MTLPSHVIWCSWSERPGSALASRPADGSRGPRLDARLASAVAASGGRLVTWIATRPVSSSARAISRRRRASGREPVRDDRDHGAAGLDARAQRLDQQPGLLGRGRLGNGVDAPFRADQPLGFESEGDDHRRRPRRRRGVQIPALGVGLAGGAGVDR